MRSRRIASLACLSAAGLVVLVGVASLLYGGYLSAITTSDGNTPFDLPGFVFCILGLAIMGAGGGVGRLIAEHFETPDFDPVDDLLIIVVIVAGLAMAAFVVRIVVAFAS